MSMPIRLRIATSASCEPRPAPRPARSSALRSNTSTRQPIERNRCAANMPPTEPPMMSARPVVMAPVLAEIVRSGIAAQFVDHEISDPDRLRAVERMHLIQPRARTGLMVEPKSKRLQPGVSSGALAGQKRCGSQIDATLMDHAVVVDC